MTSLRPITRVGLLFTTLGLLMVAIWGFSPFKITSSSSSSWNSKLNAESIQLQLQKNQDRLVLLNDAKEMADLYLNPLGKGTILGGTTGNIHLSEESEIEFEDDQKDDRMNPMSHLQIPDEQSLKDIAPTQFLKGDATFQSFFKYIFDLINNNHLSYPLKRRMQLKNGKPIIDNVLFFADTQSRLSEFDLYSFFDFPQNFIDDLKTKHKNVVEGLPNVTPNFYSGNGYIMVGGGIYSWYALLGIETLRRVGAKYPIEVLIPDINDYEFDYCEVILPKLNARCIEMYRIFGKKTLEHFDVKGYQYKAFALLASSFENAFLLDSDAYPIKNPDILFESQLFEDYKMITWPDFWRRTGSPHFYEIEGKEIGETPIRHLNDFFINPNFIQYARSEDSLFSMTYHDRKGTLPDWTTESGEMLINKKTHFKTLLLALYYNFDGPYGYYPLLSQGGAGEGDKETFVAGANFFDLPWYQVNKAPERAFGWYNEEKRFEHSSIVQYDPLLDFEILQTLKMKLRQDMETAGDKFEYNYDNYYPEFFQPHTGEPMFYHVHDPKMDPFHIVQQGFTNNLKGEKIRNMGEDFPRTNFDLELFVWERIDHYICKERINFSAFEKYEWSTLCNEFITEELQFLRSSAKRILKDWTSAKAVDQMRGVEYE